VGAGNGMTEPPTSSPDPAAPGERDELLGTKVNIPRPRPDRPARSQLFQRLDEGISQALILVCAPAGFGKTALLADWARRSQRPVAWLSLDEADNDPARSWRYVVAALDRAREGLGEQLLPLLTALTPLSCQGVGPSSSAGWRPSPRSSPCTWRRSDGGIDRARGTDDLPDDRPHSDLSTREPQVSMRSCMDTPGKYLQGNRVGHRHASADPLVLCR
jgi:hypothetical protein